MNSEERREARFWRRQEKRRKRAEKYRICDDFDGVFTYKNMYRAYRECRKGVAWKASVQSYITQAPLNISNTLNALRNGKYRSKGFYEFDIIERGKLRHIKSVKMEERVVQRCLCDNSLIPMLTRSFIYDNGACLKDKGYTFAQKRLTRHLREHYRKHGTEGYILLFDFSKFFDNISHEKIKRILRSKLSDERILALVFHFIDSKRQILRRSQTTS